MGFKYQGDAILNVALTVDAPKPLDVRSVVNNISELYDIPAKTAYPGMTVANIDNGNIYMLVDKSKINEKAGWKASYESIQIITCTQAEYDEWSANTTPDFKPIDESKTYLHSETYYYIYEEDKGQYYLSSSWGKTIEEQLSQKASADSLNTLLSRVNSDIENLSNNYTNTETLISTYATKELVNALLDLEKEDSFISQTLSQYYSKVQADDKFVTKESLGGNLEGLEGENFVFVTSAQYAEDQKNIQNQLDDTIKTNSEGILESIVVNQIKSSEGENPLVIDVKSEGLFVNNEIIALHSEVPNIITLSQNEYNVLVENNNLIEDAYYYIYDNNETYVTLSQLQESYDSRAVYQTYVTQTCYRRTEIDDIINNLQNYIISDTLSNYYTSAHIDSTYITAQAASETYATKQELSNLQNIINEDFVTIEMLKGENSEDDDFMFVTQNQYSTDREAQALAFQSESISAETLTTTELILNKDSEEFVLVVKDDRLNINDQQVAHTSEIPKIECITQNDYDQMLEDGNLQEDTYYYTYNEEGDINNTYITLEYLNANYIPKSEVAQMIMDAISPLKARIESLEAHHNNEQI